MSQTDEIEKTLGIQLDDNYKEFVQNFDGAYVCIGIHAFSNSSMTLIR